MDSVNSSSPQPSNDDVAGDDDFDSGSNFLSLLQYSSADAATPRIAALRPPPPRRPLNHHFFDSPAAGLSLTPLHAHITTSSSAAPTLASGVDQSSVQSSKKRTRASRKPPTTVLTTDTSNFRAMVQQFTGTPSQPLAAEQPSYVRARLRLHRPGLGIHDAPSPIHPAQSPLASFFQLPLPFMQKAEYPISSVAGAAQSQALLNMRTPNHSLQSLFQPSFRAKNSALHAMPTQFEMSSRTLPSSGGDLNEPHLPRGLFAPELIMSSTASKLNFSGSSSPEFNVEKGSAAETRGEWIEDSWICSSD